MRRKLVVIMRRCDESKKPCFQSELARRLKLSHVAVLQHIALLEEEGYVRKLNPGGKPAFLALTEKGRKVAEEFS